MQSPIAASTLPQAMRDAPRRQWPWAVAEHLWPGPPPEKNAWESGIVAATGERAWETVRLPGWHHAFCKKHGC